MQRAHDGHQWISGCKNPDIPTLSCLRTQDVQEKDGTVDWTHDETLRSPAGSPLMGKWDVLESFGCDTLLRVVSQIVGEPRSTTIGFNG